MNKRNVQGNGRSYFYFERKGGLKEPVNSLVSSLENKLTGNAQTHLIGVFGINSDNVIAEALNIIRNNNHRIFLLRKSRVIDDVYNMFAVEMMNFTEMQFAKGGSYSTYNSWNEEAVICHIRRLLTEICARKPSNDPYDLYELVNLERWVSREKKCKELISFIRKELECDTKFIWNVELDFGEFNYNLVRNLAEIASEELIIIINSYGSLDIEARSMGRKLASDYPDQMGHQITNKYFSPTDIINTDN